MISGVIARLGPPGHYGKPTFSGRIHLYDSHPSSLGQALWQQYHTFFKKDYSRMLTYLIDEHPSGWNSIVKANFKHPHVSFQQRKALADKKGVDWTEIPSGPECLCHPPVEPPWMLHETNLDGLDWAYVFDNKGFTILRAWSFIDFDGTTDWLFVTHVDWAAAEPNWVALNFAGPPNNLVWNVEHTMGLEEPGVMPAKQIRQIRQFQRAKAAPTLKTKRRNRPRKPGRPRRPGKRGTIRPNKKTAKRLTAKAKRAKKVKNTQWGKTSWINATKPAQEMSIIVKKFR